MSLHIAQSTLHTTPLPLQSSHSKTYIVRTYHCTEHSIQCTHVTTPCTVHITHCTLVTTECTFYTKHFSLHSAHLSLISVQSTLHSADLSLHSAEHSLASTFVPLIVQTKSLCFRPADSALEKTRTLPSLMLWNCKKN